MLAGHGGPQCSERQPGRVFRSCGESLDSSMEPPASAPYSQTRYRNPSMSEHRLPSCSVICRRQAKRPSHRQGGGLESQRFDWASTLSRNAIDLPASTPNPGTSCRSPRGPGGGQPSPVGADGKKRLYPGCPTTAPHHCAPLDMELSRRLKLRRGRQTMRRRWL